MSTTDDFPDRYSVAQQKAWISADLNSTLLVQFLFGIYTGLFPATMYIYIHKENRTRARDMIIIGSTTALYLAVALSTLMNWLYTNILFGTHGRTRVEMFMESVNEDVPLGEDVIGDLTFFVVFLLADGLLVSVEVLSLVWEVRRSFLLFAGKVSSASAVLALTVTVYRCLADAKPNFETIQTAEIFDRLSAAGYVTVAATSLITTSVICWQIWRHTKLSSRRQDRYRTIINALIESSAIYTVTVLLLAIVDFISAQKIETESSFEVLLVSHFVEAATLVISGLAPTLMIARLFLFSSHEDTEVSSAHLPSDLISCASHATGANMTNVEADLEMQRSGSIAVGGQESEEFQEVPRNECHGQPEDKHQDRVNTIV
ncbi:hypothetical protein CPC08DRAFT_769885 [Agrocybe pediades]|nr:hypothetical protein CPC08DRAFT_769885 [Agrocybe pediades]